MYIDPQDIDRNEKLGHFNNPIFQEQDPETKFIAKYMGFVVKWDRWPNTEYVMGRGEVISSYIAKPVYKRGRESFRFNEWSWDDLVELLQAMREKADFTEDVQKAYLSLDQPTLYTAILEQILKVKEPVEAK